MRLLGWLLAAYAAIGLVFVVVAVVIGGPLVARVDRMATSATSTMHAAAQAADAAADAFGGFDSSITRARASADGAADLSRSTATTLDGLAAAMSISIFGSQPLEPLASQFAASADQLRELGAELGGIGQALDVNRDEVDRVGSRMRALATELESLEGRLADERAGGGLSISWLFYGFLLWQLLPISAAAIGGAWLLRHARMVAA
jgi:hypothetical protein